MAWPVSVVHGAHRSVISSCTCAAQPEEGERRGHQMQGSPSQGTTREERHLFAEVKCFRRDKFRLSLMMRVPAFRFLRCETRAIKRASLVGSRSLSLRYSYSATTACFTEPEKTGVPALSKVRFQMIIVSFLLTTISGLQGQCRGARLSGPRYLAGIRRWRVHDALGSEEELEGRHVWQPRWCQASSLVLCGWCVEPLIPPYV